MAEGSRVELRNLKAGTSDSVDFGPFLEEYACCSCGKRSRDGMMVSRQSEPGSDFSCSDCIVFPDSPKVYQGPPRPCAACKRPVSSGREMSCAGATSVILCTLCLLHGEFACFLRQPAVRAPQHPPLPSTAPLSGPSAARPEATFAHLTASGSTSSGGKPGPLGPRSVAPGVYPPNVLLGGCRKCGGAKLPVHLVIQNGDSQHFFCGPCARAGNIDDGSAKQCAYCRKRAYPSFTHQMTFVRLPNAPVFCKLACSWRCHAAITRFAEESQEGHLRYMCRVCLKELPSPPSRCARCRAVHYCSRECQAADWKRGHKRQCQLVGDLDPRTGSQQASLDEAHVAGQPTTASDGKEVLEASPAVAIEKSPKPESNKPEPVGHARGIK